LPRKIWKNQESKDSSKNRFSKSAGKALVHKRRLQEKLDRPGKRQERKPVQEPRARNLKLITQQDSN
jgi:hypothetical protein